MCDDGNLPLPQPGDVLARVQAVVFASGEPIELPRLAQAVEVEPGELPALVARVNGLYRQNGLPFELVVLGESVQMCTRGEFAPLIRQALAQKRNVPLSQAAFESLAIVAYNQPVTKAFVEQVRGVDSSGVMNSLVEKGLIEEAGRLELPGRPISYRTTASFLRCFSLSSLDELPSLEQEEGPAPEAPAGGKDAAAEAEALEGQLGFEEVPAP